MAIALLGMASASRASTIQANLVTVTPSGANFVYHYRVDLTSGNGLANQATNPDRYESGLIILDFAGLAAAPAIVAPGVTTAGDWAVTTVSTGGSTLLNTVYSSGVTTIFGTNPVVVAGGVDTGVTNIVLEYTGAATGIAVLGDPGSKMLPVAGFSRTLMFLDVTSSIGTHAAGAVTTLSRDTGPGTVNRPVETYSINAPVAVPLPATANMGFALIGCFGAAGLWRQIKRRQSEVV
jgi:hypothetical protein